MPTGYTCKVEDGEITELKDYLLSCARGFGAMIHMRDDSMDKQYEPKIVSDYHLNALNKAKKEYEEFLTITNEEIQQKLDESYENEIESKKEGLAKFKVQKQRYEDMLAKVETWQEPTEQHKKLKEFAIEQLKSSIDWDCSDSSEKYYLEEPVKDTSEHYKTWKLNSLLADIKYHTEHYEKECKSVEESNKWVEDLVNSILK